MLEWLQPFDGILMLILGWLFGTLSPGISERIRRRYRQQELMSCVVGELSELRVTLALAASTFRERRFANSDEFIDWLIPILHSDQQNPTSKEMADALTSMRSCPESARIQAEKKLQRPESQLNVKQYAVPFITAHLAELSTCPLRFQRAVLRIKNSLDLYNQQVSLMSLLFDRTFSAAPENHQRLLSNLEAGYEQMGKQAELIANEITPVLTVWSNRHDTVVAWLQMAARPPVATT
jgi:hypothetical protein